MDICHFIPFEYFCRYVTPCAALHAAHNAVKTTLRMCEEGLKQDSQNGLRLLMSEGT